jgi:hypothetical protein
MAQRSSWVPWARHGAGHTRDFDDLAAWLAVRTSKSAVCELLRIAKLWRAYLLKGLRYVFAVKGDEGKQALRRWLAWARRSRLPAFIDLHRKITAHHAAIDATLEHHLSQGLIESTNTKIRLLTRIAFGFHGHQPSSPLPCSPSARTHPAYRADDPWIEQKSDKCAGRRRSRWSAMPDVPIGAQRRGLMNQLRPRSTLAPRRAA